MTLNFLSLVNHVADEVDENNLTSLTFTTDSSAVYRRIKNYINAIYREVFLSRTDWSWARLKQNFSTTANTFEYGLGTLNAQTDYERISVVNVSNEAPVELLSYQEFSRKYGESQGLVTGKPYVAYVLDGKLCLFPTPDAAYTVNVIGQKLFSELSAFDDEPLIPEGKRHVLVDGALWRAKLHEREAGESQAYAQVYQRGLQLLRDSEGNNHKGYAIIPEEETITEEYLETILLE